MEDKRPIGYRINGLSKTFREKVREKASSKGIGSTYFFILMILSHQEQSVTQKEICEMCHLKAPTISLTLVNMENDGLIKREKSNTDSRKVMVSLTETGINKVMVVKSIFKELDEVMMNALDKEELEVFYRLIDKLGKALGK